MVQSTYVTQVTGTTTLSDYYDTYLIQATGAITLTLPTITCDGMVMNLIRNDTSPTGTVGVTGSLSQSIIQNLGITGGGGGTTGLSIRQQSSVQLQSYNNAWYVIQNDPINRIESKCIFSAGFGTAGLTTAGVTGSTRTVLAYFPYRGVITEAMSQFDVVVRRSTAGSTSITIDVRTLGSSTNIIAGIGTVTNTRSIISSSSIAPGLVPQTLTIMEIGITFAGSGINIITDAIVVR